MNDKLQTAQDRMTQNVDTVDAKQVRWLKRENETNARVKRQNYVIVLNLNRYNYENFERKARTRSSCNDVPGMRS